MEVANEEVQGMNKEEVRRAMKRMKGCKAGDANNEQVEAWRSLGETVNIILEGERTLKETS